MILLMMILDEVRDLVYVFSDGKGSPPEHIAKKFTSSTEVEKEIVGFDSGEEYEKAREELLERIKNGRRTG